MSNKPRIGDIGPYKDKRARVVSVTDHYDLDDEVDGWSLVLEIVEEGEGEKQEREKWEKLATLRDQLRIAMLPPDDERLRDTLEARRAALREEIATLEGSE